MLTEMNIKKDRSDKIRYLNSASPKDFAGTTMALWYSRQTTEGMTT